MTVGSSRGRRGAVKSNAGDTDSTVRMMALLEKLWRDRPEPRALILQVRVVLTKLVELTNFTPPLFQTVADAMASGDMEKQRNLDSTIDKLRARYDRKVVYFGNVQDARENAPCGFPSRTFPRSDWRATSKLA